MNNTYTHCTHCIKGRIEEFDTYDNLLKKGTDFTKILQLKAEDDITVNNQLGYPIVIRVF